MMRETRGIFGFRSHSPAAPAETQAPAVQQNTSLGIPVSALASRDAQSTQATTFQATASSANASQATTSQVPTIRLIPHITETSNGLNFPIIERKVPNGRIFKVKRFVEKAGDIDTSDTISFKSKVVSRQHGELWSQGMNFFYRDTKSSSGTFINNVRISPASTESAAIRLKDGDIIQLGVDYQGRTEDIFRCVRMRVEVNREAFKYRNNAFRNQVVKALRALATANDKGNQGTGDCCICLGNIAPFQALFIAPCCHSFHYKCVRPLLNGWPNFSCPLCRHFADLSISVSIDDLTALIEEVRQDEESALAIKPPSDPIPLGAVEDQTISPSILEPPKQPEALTGPSSSNVPAAARTNEAPNGVDTSIDQVLERVPLTLSDALDDVTDTRPVASESYSDPTSLNNDETAQMHELLASVDHLALDERSQTAASPGTVTNSPPPPDSPRAPFTIEEAASQLQSSGQISQDLQNESSKMSQLGKDSNDALGNSAEATGSSIGGPSGPSV